MLLYPTGWTIPDEERGAANKLSQNLVLLSMHLDHFETAIALFDDAVAAQAAAMESDFRAAFSASRKSAQFQLLAARDGAMTIYHFKYVRDSTPGSVRACPTLAQRIEAALFTFTSASVDSITDRAKASASATTPLNPPLAA
jgi:hypothetical protein